MKSQADPHSPQKAESSVDAPFDTGSADGWHQLETFVDQLQESAHSSIDASQFYRELLDGCVTLLAARGGAVWLPETRGRWRADYQINGEQVFAGPAVRNAEPHTQLLRNVAQAGGASVLQPHSSTQVGENRSELVLALVPVVDSSPSSGSPTAHAIVELFLSPGSSPAVQRGWRELLETVAVVASDFHLREQLRTLRSERGLYDQSIELIQRLQQSRQLQATAYEIANEGRRFAGADRLSVVAKRGTDWKVLAASGVERVEPRADVTKRLQALAAATSDWGEPVEYSDADSKTLDELPPELTRLVEQHVDESQARTLVAAPVHAAGTAEEDDRTKPPPTIAVLVAEQFTSHSDDFSRQRVLELANICAPALTQASDLDRFPMRASMRWANRWDRVCTKLGLTKLVTAIVAFVLLVATLALVRIDYEISAPATLQPSIQRDVFATTDGNVADIKFKHGDQVSAGDVLAVLHDPELLLNVQRVDGEIATTRKRLEAIAVTRTDRQVREETSTDKLPLAAEAEQLEKRLASLLTQQQILAKRRDALTLKSPIDGTVLTLDVQNLLRTRPVQRGQVLLTVSDTSGPWRLVAEVPQARIGQILQAQETASQQLPVRFRLAGETDQTYVGQLASISTNAVLDTDGLDQESPAFEVRIDIDEKEDFLPRPGMSAEVRIHCGRRSLGYVWLHDIWESIYSWLVF